MWAGVTHFWAKTLKIIFFFETTKRTEPIGLRLWGNFFLHWRLPGYKKMTLCVISMDKQRSFIYFLQGRDSECCVTRSTTDEPGAKFKKVADKSPCPYKAYHWQENGLLACYLTAQFPVSLCIYILLTCWHLFYFGCIVAFNAFGYWKLHSH